MIKDLLIKTILVISGLMASLLLCEVVLRFPQLTGLAQGRSYLRHYREVPGFGYDLKENQPPFRFIYGLNHASTVWSNELGCFDEPYVRGEDYFLLLGNSFTWGYGDFDKKFGTLLEKSSGRRVLKCGVGGYGTLNQLYKMDRVVAAAGRKPAGVILVSYLPGDFIKNYLFPDLFEVSEGRLKLKSVVNMRTGEATLCSEDLLGCRFSARDYIGKLIVFSALKRWLFLKAPGFWRFLGFGGRVHDDAAFLSQKEFPWLEAAWERTFGAYSLFKEKTSSQGVKLLVVLIPSAIQLDFYSERASALDIPGAEKRLRDFLSAEGIDYLDVTSLMRRERSERGAAFHMKFDGHFDPAGDAFTAAAIDLALRERGWVK